MTAPVRVAISVVECAGHVLVGTRQNGQPLAGLSEFPGGKCEYDETTRACAVRECREETGLIVVPRGHLVTTTQQYDHGTVELAFWRCSLSPDLPDLAPVLPPFRWIPYGDLAGLDFPAGNDEAIRKLHTSHE